MSVRVSILSARLAKHAAVVGLVAAALAGFAPSAQAGSAGSAVLVTGRDCGSKTATQSCSGPGTTLFYTDVEGGPGQGISISDTSPSGNAAASSITFSSGALPIIHQSDASDAHTRVNVNAFAYNSFVYNGDAPTLLSYAGDLHIEDSSGAPLGNYNWAGGAGDFAYVAIWDPSLVAGIYGPQDVFNNGITGYDCSTPGVLGYGETGPSALTGGEQFIHIATAACSPGSLTINPGQVILAVEFLQTPVNRGGWVDASHTFVMKLDSALPQDVRENLIANLQSTGGVPEPASWAMMILGFFGLGEALRRRRALAAAI
jgi:hypothetical protein